MNRIRLRVLCAAMIVSGGHSVAYSGDIAVTNVDSATFEIAMSLTAPGSRTLKDGKLSMNVPGGMLARAVPSDVSWELLIWKRQSNTDPWTFSRAFTIGKVSPEPGRKTLLIRPSTDEVSQAYAVAIDPTSLPPLPSIPGWQENPSPPDPLHPDCDPECHGDPHGMTQQAPCSTGGYSNARIRRSGSLRIYSRCPPRHR